MKTEACAPRDAEPTCHLRGWSNCASGVPRPTASLTENRSSLPWARTLSCAVPWSLRMLGTPVTQRRSFGCREPSRGCCATDSRSDRQD